MKGLSLSLVDPPQVRKFSIFFKAPLFDQERGTTPHVYSRSYKLHPGILIELARIFNKDISRVPIGNTRRQFHMFKVWKLYINIRAHMYKVVKPVYILANLIVSLI